MADSPKPDADGAAELIKLVISQDGSTQLSISPWIWLALMVAFVVVMAVRIACGRSIFTKDVEIDSTEFGFGQSKITLKPNIGDKTVAYKIWVELSTRKVGLDIDFDHDVISEIYDSWYAFFDVTRELIKDIPIGKVRNSSTRKIIQLSIDVLNLGLRPHLTKWQARFRRWYQYKLTEDSIAQYNPQEIQRQFPQYDEMIADMKKLNGKLIRYRERMDALVYS
jgi:hypothetical protein